MIYLFTSSNAKAFVEAANAEEAQKYIQDMQLHSAYLTWQASIKGLDYPDGTISNVAFYDTPLTVEEVNEHYRQ
jgi:hypothetical protein